MSAIANERENKKRTCHALDDTATSKERNDPPNPGQNKVVHKVAEFFAAARKACKNMSDEDFQRCMKEARLGDADVLPHGVLFEGLVESNVAFLRVMGIEAKKEKHRDSRGIHVLFFPYTRTPYVPVGAPARP
eukprot:jgi/Mesvir1/17762/Mv18999-RA.1